MDIHGEKASEKASEGKEGKRRGDGRKKGN